MVAAPKHLRPRKTPRQQRSAATRERIVEAAARVFVAHGYAAGTTNRIAEEAGLSIGSLYQYFPNKDTILIELVRRHISDGERALTRLIERGLPDSLEDRLAAFVDTALEIHRGDARLHQVMFEESPRPPGLLAELHAMQQTLVDFVAALFADDPTLDLPDPRLAAWFAVTTVESLTHRYIADHQTAPDLPAFRRELCALLIAYLRSRPR